MSAGTLWAWTHYSERNAQPTRWPSRHHRHLGSGFSCTDIDKCYARSGKVLAVVEQKRRNEKRFEMNGFQAGVLKALPRDGVPTFLELYEPERLRFKWSALNAHAFAFLASLPASLELERYEKDGILRAVSCNESGFQQVLGVLFGYSEQQVAEYIEETSATPLLQTVGEPLIRYELDAFVQRSGYYANPMLAYELAKKNDYLEPAGVSVQVPALPPTLQLPQNVIDFATRLEPVATLLGETSRQLGKRVAPVAASVRIPVVQPHAFEPLLASLRRAGLA
jgi:hypothetical protein